MAQAAIPAQAAAKYGFSAARTGVNRLVAV
jgi:hypothetical protein